MCSSTFMSNYSHEMFIYFEKKYRSESLQRTIQSPDCMFFSTSLSLSLFFFFSFFSFYIYILHISDKTFDSVSNLINRAVYSYRYGI